MVWHTVKVIMGRLLVVVLLPCLVWAGEVRNPTVPPTPTGAFRLTVDGSLVSLQAQEASLKALLEEFGRQMGIEVVVRLPREQTLTLAFDRLQVEEALERLRAYANIIYLKESTEAQAPIRRIIAIPRQPGEQTGEPARSQRVEPSDTATSRPAPFQFTFDPAQHEKKPQ
jgi:hypothetical protein